MSRFCFVHASDLRLDVPFAGAGRVPPAIADALRDASLEAWDRLVALTIERDAAFLVLAGGLYDGPKHGVRGRARLRAGLERLAERRIPAFIVTAPSDSLTDLPRREWPETVTLFGAEKPAAVTVWRGGTALATLHGMSSAPGGPSARALRLPQRGAEPGLHLGVLHLRSVERGEGSAVRADLERAGIDYWALGGIAERSVSRSADAWIVHPGTTQARNPAEVGAKGATVVEVEEGVVRAAGLVALDRVRCLRIAGGAGEVDALVGEAERLRREQEEVTLLIEIERPERGAARGPFFRPAAEETLLRDLRRRVEAWNPGVWWVGFRGGGARAAAARAGCPAGLAEEMLAQIRSLSEEPSAAARFLEKRFEPLLSTWAATLEPDDVPAFLGQAIQVAFQFLAGEDAP